MHGLNLIGLIVMSLFLVPVSIYLIGQLFDWAWPEYTVTTGLVFDLRQLTIGVTFGDSSDGDTVIILNVLPAIHWVFVCRKRE